MPDPNDNDRLHSEAISLSSPSDAVSEAAHRYQIISELMSDLAYCFRVEPDGSLVLEWMNEAITRSMGYTVQDVNVVGWQSFLYDEDVFVVLEHWQRLLAGEADAAEFRVYGENRKVVWVNNHARPVWDEARQRTTRIYGAAQDITARKEAEQHVMALNTRLRLTMKESFHRTKNNLQLIATLIDMQSLEYQGVLPADRVEQLIGQIRVLANVHNLLTLGVREEGQAPFVAAHVLLENLCALLEQMTGGRQLKRRVTDLILPQRQGTALALIINELVLNALQHGEGSVSILLTTEEEYGYLQVEDEGRGFAVDFDPDQAAQTGLQLVQDLTASDLNGKVYFENRSEGGGCVRLEFPIPPLYEEAF